MRFIFSTGSLWTYGIERCFAFAAQAGFDGVEVMADERWDTRQAAYLRRLATTHGQQIVAVHSPFSPAVPGWPADEVGRIHAALALAEEVGASVLVHHLPTRLGTATLRLGGWQARVPVPGWDADAAYRRWLEDGYAATQAATSVTMCIENMPARSLLGWRWNAHTWKSSAEIARFPAITLDTTHLGTWGQQPADVYPRLRDRVRHIHLSNYDGHEHRLPERGGLKLDLLLARLAADGYSGAVSFELAPDALQAGADDAIVAKLLTASLAQCRAWAADLPAPH